MKKQKKYIVRGFSLPTELMLWLVKQAKEDGITSTSNFLALIIDKEKKIREGK